MKPVKLCWQDRTQVCLQHMRINENSRKEWIVSNQHVSTNSVVIDLRSAVFSLQVEERQKINYWCQPEELVSSSWIQALWLRNMFLPKENQRTLSLLMLFLIQANALQNQISCSRNWKALYPDSLSPFQSDLGKCNFIICKASFQFHLLIIIVHYPQSTKKEQETFFQNATWQIWSLLLGKPIPFLKVIQEIARVLFLSCNLKAHHWYLHSWNLKVTTSSETSGLSFTTWDFRIPVSSCN